MRVRQEGFAALAGPLDAAVDLFGRPGHADIFGVQVDFGAETAADVGGDHAYFVLRQAKHEGRHQQALDVRVLVGYVERVIVGGPAVGADRGARLHGVGYQAVVDQIQLGHVRGTGKGGIDLGFVADRPLVAVIVWRGFVQGRAVLCVAYVGHGIERLVLDLDEFGGVFGLLKRFGDHHGDVVAHVARFAVGEYRVRGLLHRLSVGAGDQPPAGQSVDAVRGDVIAIEYRDDAGRGSSRRLVHADDAGVGVWRAHEHGVRHAAKIDVVGVLAGARQEAIVLFAQDGFADVGKFGKFIGTHGRLLRLSWPQRLAARPGRCSGNRCSGTGCLRVVRGFRVRSGWGCGGRYRPRSSPCRACRIRTAGRDTL